MDVRVGINTGHVISSVLGETKPHFSLIGDQIKKVYDIVEQCKAKQIVCSRQTNHFLELYTNNYILEYSSMKFEGVEEVVYNISTSRQKNQKALTQESMPGAPLPPMMSKAPEQAV